MVISWGLPLFRVSQRSNHYVPDTSMLLDSIVYCLNRGRKKEIFGQRAPSDLKPHLLLYRGKPSEFYTGTLACPPKSRRPCQETFVDFADWTFIYGPLAIEQQRDRDELITPHFSHDTTSPICQNKHTPPGPAYNLKWPGRVLSFGQVLLNLDPAKGPLGCSSSA